MLMQFDKDELIQKQLTVSMELESMKLKKDFLGFINHVESEAKMTQMEEFMNSFDFNENLY